MSEPSQLPADLVQNLRFPPRPYQVAALRSWLDYAAQADWTKSSQLLFNMATGSGKTYVMAALLLDLYNRGYRNFIFFVNSSNILAKTRTNFLNQSSRKYLFAPYIILSGHAVTVRGVRSFNDSDPNAINLLLTTTQKLHNSLTQPRENQLTISELTHEKLVLIGDEAHHNNARITREDASSWEETIAKILQNSSQTLLLEFTATMDFDDTKIYQKYRDHTLFRYDLRSFRQDGYSKDVLIYSAAPSITERILHALIISQYRRRLALKHGLAIKPIVMFKSRTVYENQINLGRFLQIIAELKPAKLIRTRRGATGPLAQAWQFFDQIHLSSAALCRELRADFAQDKILRIDGGQKISHQQQILVNTLDEPENHYRAVFAVDMLKEGWDVLNLFDIVRLYETQAGAAGKKTTISEAQLIGRGARYCPFRLQADDFADRRKFDHDETQPLRALEQLHYHTSHDVPYIRALQTLLDQQGITDFAHRSQTHQPAPNPANVKSFAQQDHKHPDRDVVQPAQRNAEPKLQIAEHYTISLDEGTAMTPLRIGAQAELTPHVVWAALNCSSFYVFQNLARFGYASRADFVRDLERIELTVRSTSSEFSQAQKLQIAAKLLQNIADQSRVGV